MQKRTTGCGVLGAALGVCAIVAIPESLTAESNAGDVRAGPRPMLEYLPRVLELANDPPRESHLKISCQAHLNPEDPDSESFASVLTVEGRKALLIASSPHRLEEPWLTMTLRGVFVPAGVAHPTDRGTMDWAYVFDRNSDGRIDFLSYLVGPLWILPAGEDNARQLPPVTAGVEKDFFDANRDKLRMAFWHLADDNFDGLHDGLVARIVDRETGWTSGWVVVTDADFDTHYDTCTWTTGDINNEPRPCEVTGQDYTVPGMSVAGLRGIPPPADFFLDWFNEVAVACELGADRLYSSPLRPGWPYRFAETEDHLCYDELHFDTCEAMALVGDAQAQERLGFMYANGIGVENDDAIAVAWFRKSAEQGYRVGEYNLGYMYYWGRGVVEDHAVARGWYLKAAKQDYTLAQTVLSRLYQTGDGGPQDVGEAVRWITRAAFLSDSGAQFVLGGRYATGNGVEEDEVRAYAWWVLGAMNGSAQARQGAELYSRMLSRKQVKRGKELALQLHAQSLELIEEVRSKESSN